MIKIIEEYINPVFVYMHRCENCKTLFQFEREDCNEYYDGSSHTLSTRCPICGLWTDNNNSRWLIVPQVD